MRQEASADPSLRGDALEQLRHAAVTAIRLRGFRGLGFRV